MDRLLCIAPSLLSCDFGRIAEEVRRVEEAGGDWHHVDVMDGHFVPSLTIGPLVVRRIREAARIPLDVHLMISEPRRYAAEFHAAGAHALTFHVEACADESEALDTIHCFRDLGVELVGVAVSPDTPVERVEGLLDRLDMVVVMSVHPGFGGQKFMPEVLPKVERLREGGFTGRIEVDGGVSRDTLSRCVAAGADTLVAGSALFGAPDMGEEISEFRRLAGAARGTRA
jgi:ribulose-phosphate 3-epimerase